MATRWLRPFIVSLLLILMLMPVTFGQPVQTATVVFERTWARTDRPVQNGSVQRTWMWGPAPFTALIIELYADAPGGQRVVQYFDKSRMEINNPAGSQSSVWHVTNGLLVREMVEGFYQTGHDERDETPEPANVNIAGDPDQRPTYADIALWGLLDDIARPAGTLVIHRLDENGNRTTDASLAAHGVMAAERVTVPGIDHTVASPFWDFMNAAGPVFAHGVYVTDQLFVNPFYATGYPITEAWWAVIAVGGQQQDVLWQCFERRCLTWTPANPDGWKVEAGNVGQHYYQWRYAGDEPMLAPAGPTPPEGRILFESEVSSEVIGTGDMYVVNADGSDLVNLTHHPGGDGGGTWSPDGTRIAFMSGRNENGTWDIYVMQADGSQLTRLTDHPSNDGLPVWSPDGLRILFSRNPGNAIADELYIMQADGSDVRFLTDQARGGTWSPDGGRILFLGNAPDSRSDIYVINVDGTEKTNLTNNPAQYGVISWSPDGTRILLQVWGDRADIGVMNADGTGLVWLTDDPQVESGPVWSPDGQHIAFDSYRDGQGDIYLIRPDGTGLTNLTDDAAYDACQWCSWSPDSRYISFVSHRGSEAGMGWDVFAIDVQTREVWQVSATGDGSWPLWSP